MLHYGIIISFSYDVNHIPQRTFGQVDFFPFSVQIQFDRRVFQFIFGWNEMMRVWSRGWWWFNAIGWMAEGYVLIVFFFFGREHRTHMTHIQITMWDPAIDNGCYCASIFWDFCCFGAFGWTWPTCTRTWRWCRSLWWTRRWTWQWVSSIFYFKFYIKHFSLLSASVLFFPLFSFLGQFNYIKIPILCVKIAVISSMNQFFLNAWLNSEQQERVNRSKRIDNEMQSPNEAADWLS